MAETIAYDATSIADLVTDTSLTWSHTCSQLGNRILFVLAGAPTADSITGATYAGAAMTKIGDSVFVPGNRYISLFYKTGPAKGANNVVITSSSSQILIGEATSYTGASQTGQPDSNNTNTAESVNSLTISSTVVVANSWQVMIGRATLAADPISAGTGTTKRNGDSLGDGIFDSNGQLAAGSRSLQFTWTGTTQHAGGIIASFKPALFPESTSNFFLMF